MGTANRVSIRPYLVDWLKQVGLERLGTDDLSEIVNYIVLEKRMEGTPAPQPIAPSPAGAAQPDPTLEDLSELLSGC